MTVFAAAKSHVVTMIDTRTMVAHLATDEAMVTGRRAGRYIGVCGQCHLARHAVPSTKPQHNHMINLS